MGAGVPHDVPCHAGEPGERAGQAFFNVTHCISVCGSRRGPNFSRLVRASGLEGQLVREQLVGRQQSVASLRCNETCEIRAVVNNHPKIMGKGAREGHPLCKPNSSTPSEISAVLTSSPCPQSL